MKNYEDIEGVFKAYTELVNIFIKGELSEESIEVIKPYIDEIKMYNSLLTTITAINKIDESEFKSGNLDKVLAEICSLLPLSDFSYDSVNEKVKININNDKAYFFDISKQELSDGTFIISVRKSNDDANRNYIDNCKYAGVTKSDLDSYIKKACLEMCIQESTSYRCKCCECLKQFRNSMAHGRVYLSNDDSKKINFRVKSKYLENFSMNIDELQDFASNIEQVVLDNFEIERSELPCDGVKLNNFIDQLFDANNGINSWEQNIPRLYATLLLVYNLYISDLFEKIFNHNLAMSDSNFYLTEDLEVKDFDYLPKGLKQISEQIKKDFDIRDLILRYPSFYGKNQGSKANKANFLEILENPTLGYRDLTDESKKNLWNLFLESEYGDELRAKLKDLNLENLFQNKGTYPNEEELKDIESTLECDDLLYYMIEKFPALGRIGENKPYVRNIDLFYGFKFELEKENKEFCYPPIKDIVRTSKDDIKGIIFTFVYMIK